MKKGRGLKIGVIGLGVMGQHHARIANQLPGTKLAAIAELDELRARETGAKYDVPFFTDYNEIFSEVDAISVVSPTQTHLKVALACLDANKHLLVEKPLALTPGEALQIVERAKDKNLVLAVGHIERFNPAFQTLRRLVRKERLIGINVQRFSPFPARISDANVIQDMMIHDLDLLAALLPTDEVEGMRAKGEKVKSKTFDRVAASIYYKSGVIAKVEADRVFSIKTRKISVTTEKQIYEADLLNKRIYIRDLQHHVPSTHHVKQSDQLTEELLDFIKAIKTGRQPLVSGEAGYQATKLAEEVEKACS